MQRETTSSVTTVSVQTSSLNWSFVTVLPERFARHKRTAITFGSSWISSSSRRIRFRIGSMNHSPTRRPSLKCSLKEEASGIYGQGAEREEHAKGSQVGRTRCVTTPGALRNTSPEISRLPAIPAARRPFAQDRALSGPSRHTGSHLRCRLEGALALHQNAARQGRGGRPGWTTMPAFRRKQENSRLATNSSMRTLRSVSPGPTLEIRRDRPKIYKCPEYVFKLRNVCHWVGKKRQSAGDSPDHHRIIERIVEKPQRNRTNPASATLYHIGQLTQHAGKMHPRCVSLGASFFITPI